MKKRLTINKVIIVVIFAVFIFSLVRQELLLKRIKERYFCGKTESKSAKRRK